MARRRFEDVEHLLRLVLLFGVGFGVFLVVRAVLVPEGFGELGFYRAGALADNRDQALVHAGGEACAACHGDVVAARAGGAHERIGCEACHGPLAAHAADPVAIRPERPAPSTLCRVCHEASVTRPAGFPQVVPREHSGGEACDTCHVPHAPGLGEAEAG